MMWTPRDVVALVMVIGALILRGLGIDHITEWIIIGVGGAYLGLSVTQQTIKETKIVLIMKKLIKPKSSTK